MAAPMEPIEQVFETVWSLGHQTPKSFDAHSYFVRAPAGNLLVDVPSVDDEVVNFLDQRGGLKWIFLTHRDDVGDCARFVQRFGATALIHSADRSAADFPVTTFEDDFKLAEGLQVICTPGHTPGSACLLYAAHGGVLFSGDHLMLSKGNVKPVQFAWTADWDAQLDSAVKLLTFDFEAVLPGHSQWKNGLKGAKAKLERNLSEIEAERM
jgi:glyoxylase-like metal-dependent hydrolase (beta-lactamase superfamily II)